MFECAQEIYWLPTYLSREAPELEILTPAELTSGLNDTEIRQADLDDKLWDEIQRHINAGHLVLCMGAGSIDGWVRQQLVSN